MSRHMQKTVSEPEADLESLTYVDSVFSAAPSALTSGSSIASGPANSTIDQVRKLAQVLLNDGELKDICVIAVSRVNKPKWRAHLKGFLREYSTALKIEASDFLETQVASFVEKKAGTISDAMHEMIAFPTEFLDLDKEARIQLEHRLADVLKLQSEGVFSNKGEDDEESEPGEDSDLQFELLNRLEDFLVHGDAFQSLIQSLRQWLHLPQVPKGHMRTPGSSEERPQQIPEQEEPTNSEERYATWVVEQLRSRASNDNSLSLATAQPWSISNYIKGSAEDFFGGSFNWWPLAPRVKEVPKHKTRLTWDCVSGTP